MYRKPVFSEERPEALAELVDHIAFAHLVTSGPDGLSATSLPLLLVAGDGGTPDRLVGHVARANPHWRHLGDGVPGLAVFAGPDGYVSPGAYPSKAADPRVVPTWNYVAVHAHGRVVARDEPAWKLDLVARLTERHERERDRPWSVTDAPEDFVERMVGAIVGVELVVDRLEGIRKLSQNRSAADVAGVIGALDRGERTDRDLADAMRAAAIGP